MTSREELTREVFDSFNEGDFELRPEVTHPDIEIVTETTRLSGEPYRGHEGVRRWIAETFEAFDEWKLAIDEIEERGPDRVLIVGAVHLRGRGSGVTVDLPCPGSSTTRASSAREWRRSPTASRRRGGPLSQLPSR